MALFNIMRIPLTLFPMTLREVIKTYVSIQRITIFLNAEELDLDCITEGTKDSANAVEIENASLTWEDEDNPTLKHINVNIPKGSLTAIVGTVGMGKSSILSALLGEMEKVEGKVCRHGSTAYVAQQAWIQNLSLRDNILFGSSFEGPRYKQVIEACSLKADLQILMHGDATEIGENGINLSGGQKQRVNLARAVYSNSDIYLLDDPLSAVDAHVGKHIFDNVISNDSGSLLADKTRVWVTNNLSYLPYVDHIIVLESGEICEQGHFKDLIRQKSTLARLLQDKEQQETETSEVASLKDLMMVQDEQDESKDDHQEDISERETEGKLVKDETAETGSVRLSVYLQYFKSLSYTFSFGFVFCMALQVKPINIHLKLLLLTRTTRVKILTVLTCEPYTSLLHFLLN
jgi:ATP-binding cassette subfamily C (CFTR/MRP) protein 1